MYKQWRKVVRLGALLLLMVCPGAGYAQFYIGGGGGQATYKDVDQVESACGAIGAVCDVDDGDSAFKAYAGFRFGQHLALEGGYVDLGEATADSAVPISARASLSAEGGYVSLLPRIPIGTVGSIFGRIGLSAVEAELTATAPGVSSSDSSGAAGLVFGAGAEIQLTPNIAVRGEWERHSFDEALEIAGVEIDAPDIDMLSAGIVFSF